MVAGPEVEVYGTEESQYDNDYAGKALTRITVALLISSVSFLESVAPFNEIFV